MMIKVNNDYLDFNALVEMESQAKLFEDIETSDGDYSYDFDLPWTAKNLKALKILPDNILKSVYSKIQSQLISDSGLHIYDGYIRVEQVIREVVIKCSFFAGNNNWFGLLSGPLSDIDFSEFDVDQNTGTIVASHSLDEGVVFPLVDNGGLITRGYRLTKVEDYVGAIYVKTVFKKIFQFHSIKIKGDIINDPTYNAIITMKNAKSQVEIDAASSYAGKTTTTARPVELTDYKITFQTDSVFPYYDGSLDGFDITNSRYIAPYTMRVHVEVSLKADIIDASYNNRIYLYINGVWNFVDIGLSVGGLYNSAPPGSDEFATLDRIITLQQGDILEIYSEWQQSTGSTQNDILSGSVKITPEYIYSVFGNAVVPKWTQAEYVSNVLRIFNVIPSFNPKTKTLTLNYFDKIKATEAIDLSPYISSTIVDYKEFISNYGKRNNFQYNDVDFGDLRSYNVQNFFKYGTGYLPSTNQFLSDSEDVIDSDFSNPIDYLNSIFDMSMSRTNLIEHETSDNYDIMGVADSGGSALITTLVNNLIVGDLVRISDSSNETYNGDWRLASKSATYVVGSENRVDMTLNDLPFDTDATASITKLIPKYNDTDDVYLLWNVPFYDVNKFSGFESIKLETGNRLFMSFAYFSLLDLNRQVNIDYKQSLTFGDIEDPLFYQRTILQTYWGLFGKILNDPVKLISTANIPYNIFLKIDFLRCITIKTLETTNKYYLNRITGYTGSERECQVELIKLS